jgi:8-oxo-dGTP pyrophosphatase MutT (NUDIX family)
MGQRIQSPNAPQETAPIREDHKTRFRVEVHVAGVCVRPKDDSWEVLIAKRSEERHLYPGKWECGGGRVNYGEGFEGAIKRQIFEEFGLDIEPCDLLETYEIHIPGQRVIPGLRFLCMAGGGRIRLNKREFSEYRWVRFPVPANLDWIDGVKRILDSLWPDLSTKSILRKAPDSERRLGYAPSRVIH